MIPTDFFAFPLNLILALIWVSACVMLWRKMPKSMAVRFILSPSATILALSLFLTACLVLGFTGNADMAGTWWFAAVMLFLQTVLLFVTMRGWRRQTATGARLGSVRWRFILLHSGLLVALASAFWGKPDTEVLRMQLKSGEASKEAYDMQGRAEWLPYEVVLEDFEAVFNENGMPVDYTAIMTIDERKVVLKVNHPYSRSFGEDIYLTGYDSYDDETSRSCIIQIVREPWKHGVLAGIVLLLAGAFLLFIKGPDRNSVSSDDD